MAELPGYTERPSLVRKVLICSRIYDDDEEDPVITTMLTTAIKITEMVRRLR
jgi:hypothetical protein